MFEYFYALLQSKIVLSSLALGWGMHGRKLSDLSRKGDVRIAPALQWPPGN